MASVTKAGKHNKKPFDNFVLSAEGTLICTSAVPQRRGYEILLSIQTGFSLVSAAVVCGYPGEYLRLGTLISHN